MTLAGSTSRADVVITSATINEVKQPPSNYLAARGFLIMHGVAFLYFGFSSCLLQISLDCSVLSNRTPPPLTDVNKTSHT